MWQEILLDFETCLKQQLQSQKLKKNSWYSAFFPRQIFFNVPKKRNDGLKNLKERHLWFTITNKKET